jgi:hypothetical protein
MFVAEDCRGNLVVIWYLTKPALQSMGCTSKATKESFVVPSQAGLIPEAGVCGRALHHIFPDVADVKSHLQMFPDVPSFRIPSGNLKWLKKLPTASRGYSKRTCKNNLHRTYRNRCFFFSGPGYRNYSRAIIPTVDPNDPFLRQLRHHFWANPTWILIGSADLNAIILWILA